MNEISSLIDGFTLGCCGAIIIVFFIARAYIVNTDSSDFVERKKWIDQLPSIISTLGVIGTFLGITKGLMSFDTEDLDTSVPILLDGLKTAFLTSLLGMTGSLILNRIVCHKFDKNTSESEEFRAAKLIVEELKKGNTELSNLLNKNQTDLVRELVENNNIKAIRQDVEQLKDDIEEIKGHVGEQKGLTDKMVGELESIKSAAGNNAEEISRVRAVLMTATASVSAIDNNVGELSTTVSGISSDILEIKDNLSEVQSYMEDNYND